MGRGQSVLRTAAVKLTRQQEGSGGVPPHLSDVAALPRDPLHVPRRIGARSRRERGGPTLERGEALLEGAADGLAHLRRDVGVVEQLERAQSDSTSNNKAKPSRADLWYVK